MSCDVGDVSSDFLEERTVFEPFLYAFDTRFNCFHLISFFRQFAASQYRNL
jgi:hypothetical protein